MERRTWTVWVLKDGRAWVHARGLSRRKANKLSRLLYKEGHENRVTESGAADE